jgi:hypothetical protein
MRYIHGKKNNGKKTISTVYGKRSILFTSKGIPKEFWEIFKSKKTVKKHRNSA